METETLNQLIQLLNHLSGLKYPNVSTDLVVAFVLFCAYVIALLKYCLLPEYEDKKMKFINKILAEIEIRFVEFKEIPEFKEILTKIKLILENKILVHM